MMKVSIVGAGAMGGALALAFERAGSEVALCATEFDVALIDEIRRTKAHPVLNMPIPSSIRLIDSGGWSDPLSESDICVIAVASVGVGNVVSATVDHLGPRAVYAIASKGWDPDTAEPLSVVVDRLAAGHPIVVMVGPTLAGELAGGTPTAMLCASRDTQAAQQVADAVSSHALLALVTDDVAGVEVGAALKNVLAIAIGLCEGVGQVKGRPMTNTRAALFSRGLVEMAKLAVAMGGRAETVLGLSGAGDLFVTVLGGRNGRFGRLVGTGLEPKKAFSEMGTTVEGYENTKEARALGERHGLDLPVVNMVHAVLYEGADPDEAIASLMLAGAQEEM